MAMTKTDPVFAGMQLVVYCGAERHTQTQWAQRAKQSPLRRWEKEAHSSCWPLFSFPAQQSLPKLRLTHPSHLLVHLPENPMGTKSTCLQKMHHLLPCELLSTVEPSIQISTQTPDVNPNSPLHFHLPTASTCPSNSSRLNSCCYSLVQAWLSLNNWILCQKSNISSLHHHPNPILYTIAAVIQ